MAGPGRDKAGASPPPPPPPRLSPVTPLTHGNHHLPPRPTLGGLISTSVSPLPPPLLLLFLSSALRSLSLKMVTPQSLFTLFGMFNLYYSICKTLSVNPVLFTFFSDVVDTLFLYIFLFLQASFYYIVHNRLKILCLYFERIVSLRDCPLRQLYS